MKLLFLALYVFVMVACQRRGTGCPSGYLNHGSSCYLFSNTIASYAEANSYCQYFSSNLVVIASRDEDAFIRGYLLRNGQAKPYFIAGTDIRVQGIWDWENPFRKITYANFWPGETDNLEGQNCLVLWPDYDYQWGDTSCHARNRFICETTR